MKLNQLFYEKKDIEEATTRVPLTGDEIVGLRELLEISDRLIDISEINHFIQDSGLNDEIEHAVAMDPCTDIRPIVIKWLDLNMPDFFNSDEEMMGDGNGLFSPLHGYTTTEREGTTGNF